VFFQYPKSHSPLDQFGRKICRQMSWIGSWRWPKGLRSTSILLLSWTPTRQKNWGLLYNLSYQIELILFAWSSPNCVFFNTQCYIILLFSRIFYVTIPAYFICWKYSRHHKESHSLSQSHLLCDIASVIFTFYTIKKLHPGLLISCILY